MCNCIEEANGALEPHKTRLSGGITMQGRFVLCVATERTDMNKRKHPMNVFCTFCPFCGERFAAQQPAQGEKE